MAVPGGSAGSLILRLLIAAGLVVDAVIHLRLAGGYQLAQPGGIGEGNLFRIEAVVALLVAAYLLLRPSRAAYGLAALVALSALAAVVVSRYVNLPAFGPIPSTYEPIWFFQKTLSAVAEGAAGALALIGMFMQGQRNRPAR
ncbi:MAG: hypothetical protein M3130_10435 [Actinomycetota bacterium]|nr:hypothetical protein [Actinomycetota bacterium]